MLSFDIPETKITVAESLHKEEEEKESYGRVSVNLLMNIFDYRPIPRFPVSNTYFILEYIMLYPKNRMLELYFSPTDNWRRSYCMKFKLRDDKSIEEAKRMKDLIEQLALAKRMTYINPYVYDLPKVRFELTIEPEGTTIPVSKSERLPNIRIGITDTTDKSNTWHLFGMTAGIEVDR